MEPHLQPRSQGPLLPALRSERVGENPGNEVASSLITWLVQPVIQPVKVQVTTWETWVEGERTLQNFFFNQPKM